LQNTGQPGSQDASELGVTADTYPPESAVIVSGTMNADYRTNNSPAQKLQIARINRKLARSHRKVRTSRSRGEMSNLGDHYMMDIHANMVIETHVKLDEVERSLA